VLGEQLDAQSFAWQGFDAAHDVICMPEGAEASTHVWPARQRNAITTPATMHRHAQL
jgi:deoxyribodipyrimidine photolyase-related protein